MYHMCYGPLRSTSRLVNLPGRTWLLLGSPIFPIDSLYLGTYPPRINHSQVIEWYRQDSNSDDQGHNWRYLHAHLCHHTNIAVESLRSWVPDCLSLMECWGARSCLISFDPLSESVAVRYMQKRETVKKKILGVLERIEQELQKCCEFKYEYPFRGRSTLSHLILGRSSTTFSAEGSMRIQYSLFQFQIFFGLLLYISSSWSFAKILVHRCYRTIGFSRFHFRICFEGWSSDKTKTNDDEQDLMLSRRLSRYAFIST